MASQDLKLLWGRAASTCAMCRRRLDAVSSDGRSTPIGEAAHIVAQSEMGPRGQSILGQKERESYLNLVLLCPTCHTTIDSDPVGYPVEKLHMLKAEHELRVQGTFTQYIFENEDDNKRKSNDLSAIVAFIMDWKEFLPFWTNFFNIIGTNRYLDTNAFEEGRHDSMLEEWHSRRDRLKELLYLAKEESLIVQKIPDWERLKAGSKYLSEGEYKTPFSFMLDFVNPYAMVYHHGDELWPASFISQEYIDYLSFKYKEIKQIWRVYP